MTHDEESASIINMLRRNSKNGKRRRKLNITRYQWFWAVNYRDLSALTPDLRHSVKRRVIVKRVIPTQDFPISRLQSAREVFSSQQACEENTRLKSIYETNKPALLCCDMKLYIGDHVESI
ncbi:hypothetical protein PCH_Pc24g00390 [Penicillium rubens Wisconsin 54-1255]|uniref:Uncharacterized protein n=1 Tax=Penicillium rubens (strain ATCC 28089 / DSM 1075 / NRRL 1951 / Wisconsin 54-1255) TaxID=500485 RepID=B6HWK1_PENRW|nr:hypothetical protein PCH_Pc24g00390 [Penicillium rubens Wisconsin 54-1255]